MNPNYKIPRYHEKFGKFLKRARLNAGLTQKNVSDTLGYSSAQFISNFERGIALPPIKKMKMIIKMYRLGTKDVVKRLTREIHGEVARALNE